MTLQLFSGTLAHNENIKEEMVFNNPAEFQRQVREELEGSGFELTMNSTSSPRLFICNIAFNDRNEIDCQPPQASDKNFCMISTKQRSESSNAGIKTNVVITGFRRKPGTTNALEKYKQTVPVNNPLTKKPEKEICEESSFWNELHQTKNMSVDAFKVCLADISNAADLGLARTPPNVCNLGSAVGKNGNYNIISNTSQFIWIYINTKFHNSNDTNLPLKFLVYVRNKPDIVVP
jgi:hypothetical protein